MPSLSQHIKSKMTSSIERYSALVDWVREGGGHLHKGVEIAQIDGMRGSFRATENVSGYPRDTRSPYDTSKLMMLGRFKKAMSLWLCLFQRHCHI